MADGIRAAKCEGQDHGQGGMRATERGSDPVDGTARAGDAEGGLLPDRGGRISHPPSQFGAGGGDSRGDSFRQGARVAGASLPEGARYLRCLASSGPSACSGCPQGDGTEVFVLCGPVYSTASTGLVRI